MWRISRISRLSKNVQLVPIHSKLLLNHSNLLLNNTNSFWSFPHIKSGIKDSTNQKENHKLKEETGFETALREAKDDALLNQNKLQDSIITTTPKKSLSQRIKDEILHFWHGLKLLGVETSISTRLLWKLLKGLPLSRREYRQLKRTIGDLLRLVPLLVLVIVPFLEFAIPVLLKIFPNMLPSTFESKFQEEEKKKNLLLVRIKMAKFLQETVGEVALSGTAKADAAKEFSEFFSNVRTSGMPAPTEDVLRVARKFQDELTLNNMSRPQLVSLARFMNLNAFGTDSFLRNTINSRLLELKQDDQMIFLEGVKELTISELQYACSARGIVTQGVSPARMRSELQQWLELHLVHKIPSSILLLSHAFQTSSRLLNPGEDVLTAKAPVLQATLSSLPHQVVNETQLKISEQEGVATYKQRLDVVKEQEEMIQDELEQDAEQEAKKKAKIEEKKLLEQEAAKASESTTTPVVQVDAGADAPATSTETLVTTAASQPAPVPEVKPAEPTVGEPAVAPPATPTPVVAATTTATEDKDDELSENEIKNLAKALKAMSQDSALSDVKQDLVGLKEDRQEFIEDVEEYKQFTQKEPPKSTDRLGTTVDKMIAKIEIELEKYDSEIGSKLNLVKPNLEGQISIQDLEQTLRVIRDHPNDDRISKIVTKLDADNDGLVAMNEILALAEETEGHGEVIKPESASVPAPAVTDPSSPEAPKL